MPPARPTDSTESLPGYTDLVEIGRGGDSVVYRARETALGREVAIKVLLTSDADRAVRFAREVEITLELGRQHPNIVTVLAAATAASGRPAIVMEYYEGGTLHDRLRAHGPLPPEEVVRIGAVLADALAFAHERGVLHRDVKPQNVLVLPTSWVLADFGIARLADSEHTASVETFTYRHAAPQILDGHAPTAADDLWSLGSTLHTLVDGRPPFASDDPDDDSALAYLRRVRTEQPRPLSADVGPLAEVVARCLRREVADRWGGAAELRDALLALQHTTWQPDHPGKAPAPAASARPESPVPPATVPPATVPPATVPPAPSALALSAAGHAVADSRDDVPTGTVAPGVEPSDAVPAAAPQAPRGSALPSAASEDDPPANASPGARRLRPRPLLVLALVAVLSGIALGLAGSAMRGDDGDAAEPSSAESGPAVAPIPTLATAPVDPDPQPDVVDEALRFALTDLRSDGATLEIAWRDPTDGEALFHLTQTAPEENLLARFQPGSTSASFPHPLPVGRSCFVMFLHLPDGRIGQSNQRCLRHEGD